MKSRMRRFWMSVSLATSALAFPLSSSLWSHDLPIRWTSGANSTPSWNQLLDDCMDLPQQAGPRSLLERTASHRPATEDWASSCPAEWTQTSGLSNAHTASIGNDLLMRNPISRFSREMTCWVNEWQDYQHQSVVTPPADQSALPLAWAARPAQGLPPAPAPSSQRGETAGSLSYGPMTRLEALAVQSLPSLADNCSDTCMFDVEYQARQAAADLLAAEIARAETISRNEARVAQALADAQALAQAAEQDAVLEGNFINQRQPAALAAAPSCGGELREIITQNCFPNRFAPGIVDEYLAYDVDDRDSHWLGGLSKSWKLRSSLGSERVGKPLATGQHLDQAVPVAIAAPEDYVAPDTTLQLDGGIQKAETASTLELNRYLDQLVDKAQKQAIQLLEDAIASSTATSTAPKAAEGAIDGSNEPIQLQLPSISQQLAGLSDWIETQQCLISAELCGFDHIYQIGRWVGTQTLELTSSAMSGYIAMGHYLESTATIADLVVIYVDADGTQLVVPGSVARAWNHPMAEIDTWSMETSSEPHGYSAGRADDWLNINSLRSRFVKYMAQQLDAVGMACLQTADQLTSWDKIANRDGQQPDSDVR